MLIADTAAEIASLLLVRDIKKRNERRGRWKEMLSGDKSTGIRTLCWGKLVKDYRFKSLPFWPLFAAYLCRPVRVYSSSHQVHTHTRTREFCESRSKGDKKKKWTKQEEVGGLGRYALYTAGARC